MSRLCVSVQQRTRMVPGHAYIFFRRIAALIDHDERCYYVYVYMRASCSYVYGGRANLRVCVHVCMHAEVSFYTHVCAVHYYYNVCIIINTADNVAVQLLKLYATRCCCTQRIFTYLQNYIMTIVANFQCLCCTQTYALARDPLIVYCHSTSSSSIADIGDLAE